MPRSERFSSKNQNSVFGKIVQTALSDATVPLLATDFIESPQGLGVKLFPIQKLIVKSIFGQEMDDKTRNIEMWDTMHTTLLRTVSEAEFFHIMHDQGRCNINDWRDMPERGYNEAAIFAGRRGGKSQLVSAVAGYALYRLLNIRSPQEFWGLVPGSPIDFTFLAQDDEGAGRLYDKLRADVNRSSWFTPYLRVSANTEMKFVSEADRHKRDVTPSITIASYPCTTTSVRGPSSVFLAFDEFAHFRSAKGASSDEVYAAATPSTTNFSHKETNEETHETTDIVDRLIMSISSPWKKVGKMYDLHKKALTEGANSSIFTLRISTAEMNPKIVAKVLADEYSNNPMTYKAEFGGEFLESSETYVKESQLKACVDVQWDENGEAKVETARRNLVRWSPNHLGRQYFWWIDLALEHDGTAVAVGHLESGGAMGIKLVFDYIDRMMVGEEFEWPYVINDPFLQTKKYLHHRALPLEDVIHWLKGLNEIMPCYRGGTDQYGGQMLTQLLAMNSINNIELINLTPALNSQMAFALKGYIDKGGVSFPYVPKYIHEMKMVEAQYTNKYQVRVEAPSEAGSHDDMSDATQGVAFLALRWLQQEGRMLMDPTGQSLIIQEQMNKPPTPLTSVDAVSLQDLRHLERARKMNQQFGMGSTQTVVNPFHVRKRR